MNQVDLKLNVATLADIADVLALQSQYHIASIAEEDKASGFVTTFFTPAQLSALIQDEAGLFVGHLDGYLVAYVMAA